MPMSGNVMAAARKAAKDAVTQKWLALGRALLAAEVDQMKLEIDQADSGAIVAHVAAFAEIAGTPAGLISAAPGSPVTGPAVFPPGSIT